MKRWTTALGALMVMTTGCQGIVRDPVQGAATSAVAMRYGSLSPAILAEVGSFAATGPTPPDPDGLVLFFSSEPLTCSQPVGFTLSGPEACPGPGPQRWQAELYIPPALAQAGTVDLADMRIFEWATMGISEGCGEGGGSSPPGTLDLVSLDAASITLTLSGVTAISTSIDGPYVAQRCDGP